MLCRDWHAGVLARHRTARGSVCERLFFVPLPFANCFFFLLTGWTTSELFQCILCSFPVRPFCAAPGHVCAWRDNMLSVGCVFSGIPLGVGRKALHQVQRQHLHVRGFIGGRGIAHPPSSSHPRCISTLSPCSTEEEGLAPLPSSSQCRGVHRRTGTGPPPHTNMLGEVRVQTWMVGVHLTHIKIQLPSVIKKMCVAVPCLMAFPGVHVHDISTSSSDAPMQGKPRSG